MAVDVAWWAPTTGAPPRVAGGGHGTAPAHGGAPTTGPPPRVAGGGHGTAPVGGTTGAVGEPSSGGEKPVRQSLNPEGERVGQSCLMERCLRKSRAFAVDIALRRRSEPLNPQIRLMLLECSTTRGVERTGAPRGVPGGLRPRRHGAPSLTGGGAVLPRGFRATRRALSRSSQWVKPATIGPSVDCPRVGTRGPAVGLKMVAGTASTSLLVLLLGPRRGKVGCATVRRAAPGRSAPHDSRPASTASATLVPSSAAARTAVQQWPTHTVTPATSPRP